MAVLTHRIRDEHEWELWGKTLGPATAFRRPDSDFVGAFEMGVFMGNTWSWTIQTSRDALLVAFELS